MTRPAFPATGQVVRLARARMPVVLEQRLGEGGQGVVFRASTADGAAFAVKWYRPSAHLPELRRAIDSLVVHGRPHPAFIWPIDVVECEGVEGFGYVMALIEPRFRSFAQVLAATTQPSFASLALIGLDLADAFAALHGSGLCYRDISFGNLLVDPDRAEVAIADNDNVGLDRGNVFVRGTLRFMAPEVVTGVAQPSTITDLHSLAVLLFYLFVHGHPLEGAYADLGSAWRRDAQGTESEIASRYFGSEPLFVFDPGDGRNRPVSGDPMLTWWPIYPRFFHELFVQAFTVGLRTPTLSARVTEGAWRRALLRMRDCVSRCGACGAAVIWDPDGDGPACWRCGRQPARPPLLEVGGATLTLVEGQVLTRHHLWHDRDYRAPAGLVEAHPDGSAMVVLRNMTDAPWTAVPEGEAPRVVAPRQRVLVRPMSIDFGPVRGVVRSAA